MDKNERPCLAIINKQLSLGPLLYWGPFSAIIATSYGFPFEAIG